MSSPTTSPVDDDAQRALERRALRNVRDLVDRIEDDERKQSRITLRFVVASVVVALVAAIALYFVMVSGKKAQAPVVSPANVAPPK
jgi:hypothetical protein